VTGSSNGRRVLVAVVTGPAGDAIRAWREEHDPAQARRLPPHATLCYQVTGADLDALDRQVRHAFPEPVTVTLGGVHEFDNREGTFYVEVCGTDALDAARRRLYDGSALRLPGPAEFTWHVTCVRYPDDAEGEELRAAATDLERQIATAPEWTIDTIALLELRGDRYVSIMKWHLSRAGDSSIRA
jgi:2'-5' RNA ligase